MGLQAALLLCLVAAALADDSGASNHTISRCTDANDCFRCFKQKECTKDAEGNTYCRPCGWCTDEYDETNWDDDTYGECVVATPGMEKCAETISPQSDPYCPDSVCVAGEKHCNCLDNVCPEMDLLFGLFSMEGFWLLLLLIFMFSMGLASACLLNSCFRPKPREVIVYRQDAPQDTYVRMDEPEA